LLPVRIALKLRGLHPGKLNRGDVRVDFVNSVDASGGLRTSIRTFGDLLSLKSVHGLDDATGLGTPTAALLGSLSH